MKIELTREQEDWLIRRVPGRYTNLEAAARAYFDKIIVIEEQEAAAARVAAQCIRRSQKIVPDYATGKSRPSE